MSLFFSNPLVTLVLVLGAGLAVSLVIPASNTALVRRFTLAVSIVALVAGLLACLGFDKSNLGFQFLFRFNLVPEYNLALTLGADGLSMVFLLLTLFIFPILFLSS